MKKDSNTTFIRRKSIIYLQRCIKDKEQRGWSLVGRITQSYNGEYCCMMQKENTAKGA